MTIPLIGRFFEKQPVPEQPLAYYSLMHRKINSLYVQLVSELGRPSSIQGFQRMIALTDQLKECKVFPDRQTDFNKYVDQIEAELSTGARYIAAADIKAADNQRGAAVETARNKLKFLIDSFSIAINKQLPKDKAA